MNQMEDMLSALEEENRQKEILKAQANERRKQISRPLQDEVSLSTLGGYMFASFAPFVTCH